MQSVSKLLGALLVLMSTSCGAGGAGPSEQEIVDSLEEQLRAVNGDWTGFSTGPNAVQLNFTLQQGSNGQLSGTGSFKEEGATAVLPITISGSFQRPTLTLSFGGITYEGRQVTAVAQGSYTSVGGITATLSLTAPDYTRNITVLLQEK